MTEFDAATVTCRSGLPQRLLSRCGMFFEKREDRICDCSVGSGILILHACYAACHWLHITLTMLYLDCESCCDWWVLGSFLLRVCHRLWLTEPTRLSDLLSLLRSHMSKPRSSNDLGLEPSLRTQTVTERRKYDADRREKSLYTKVPPRNADALTGTYNEVCHGLD